MQAGAENKSGRIQIKMQPPFRGSLQPFVKTNGPSSVNGPNLKISLILETAQYVKMPGKASPFCLVFPMGEETTAAGKSDRGGGEVF